MIYFVLLCFWHYARQIEIIIIPKVTNFSDSLTFTFLMFFGELFGGLAVIVYNKLNFLYRKKQNKQDEAIVKILTKGKTPIVVGGTGLYIDSLIYGIDYNEIKVDLNYRNELEELIKSKGLDYLYDMAKEIDNQAMEKISRNDKKRICRVLEIYKSTGKTKTQMEAESRKNEVKYDFKVFAIDMDREKLYDRINRRVDLMIEAGLIEEVRNLVNKYPNMPTAMQGLGYKEVVQYFNGEYSKEEMIEKIKQESRRYAKRQLTWFRKNKEIKWIDASKSLEENTNFIIEEIR